MRSQIAPRLLAAALAACLSLGLSGCEGTTSAGRPGLQASSIGPAGKDTPPPTPTGPVIWEFSCPPAGTKARYTNGRSIVWSGAEPDDSMICLGLEDGREVRRILALVDAPRDREAASGYRAGVARLFPARVGSSTSLFVPGGVNAEEVWQIRGVSPVTVEGRLYRVVRLNRVQRQLDGTSWQAWDYKIDAITGTMIGFDMAAALGGRTVGAPGVLAVAIDLPEAWPPRPKTR